MTVRVFQQGLEGATQIGSDLQTDSAGVYQVIYTFPSPAPHIYVQVFSSGGAELLKRSTLSLGVSETHRVDLQIESIQDSEDTEYDKVDQILSPLVGSANYSNFNEQSVFVLAGESKLPIPVVQAYIVANKLSLVLTPSTEALFGLVREGLPTNPNLLLALESAVITRAIERASNHKHIDSSFYAQASTIATQLKTDAVDWAKDTTVPRSIGQVLSKGSDLSDSLIEKFVRMWHEHSGSTATFWTELAADQTAPIFTTQQIDDAKRAIRLGLITLHHPPMIEAFEGSTFGSGDLSQVVQLKKSDWLNLMVSTPIGIQGDTENDRRDNYADLLIQQSAIAFPSNLLVEAYLAADPTSSEDLTKFLTNNPTFSFGKTNTETFFELPPDLTGVGDSEALKQRLKLLQRLFRISPRDDRFAVMTILEDNGIRAAQDIVRMGQNRFLNKFDSLLGESTARIVYARAHTSASMSQMLYAQNASSLKVRYSTRESATDNEPSSTTVPSYTDIFVTQANCACGHCSSILSPAAYLVDLLDWLSEREALASLEYLDEGEDVTRRLDIGDIKLSCDNTNTVLPYVDLAIEVLEVGVANAPYPTTPSSTETLPTETTHSAEELLAQPEYTYTSAYDKLKDARGPLSLPFHYPLAQTQAYLAHLGIQHAVMLETFQADGSPTSSQIDQAHLRISPQLAQLLTEANPSNPEELWGYTTPDSEIIHPDPNHSTSVYWYVGLRYVPEFFSRANLSTYGDLLDLVHSRYINPSGNFDLQAVDGRGCELEQLYIGELYDGVSTPGSGLPNADDFNRVIVFRRLQVLLGWSALEIDKALQTLGVTAAVTTNNTGMSTAALSSLSALQRLQKRTKAPITALLSWWGTIDTFLDRTSADEPVVPFYDTLFLDPSVVAPEDSLFALNSTRDELETSTSSGLLASHSSELTAALKTNEEELLAAAEIVITEFDPELSDTADLGRKLDHLWRLQRRIHLSQTAGLTVAEADFFSQATGLDPFTDPATALSWFELLDEIRDSGFTISQLRWLLTHNTETYAPTDEWIQEQLGALREVLAGLHREVRASQQVDASRAMESDTLLALQRQAVFASLQDAFGLPESVLEGLRQLDFTTLLTAADYTDLFTSDTTTLYDEDPDVQESSALPLGAAGQSAEAPYADLTRSSQSNAFAAFDLMAKCAATFDAMGGISADELDWWITNQTSMGLLDLTALPLAASTANLSTLMDALWNTARLLGLRERLAGDSETLPSILTDAAAGRLATAMDNLIERTDWRIDNLKSLLNRFRCDDVDLTFPTSFNASQTYEFLVNGHPISASAATESDFWTALQSAIANDTTVGGSAAVPLIEGVLLDSNGAEGADPVDAVAIRIRQNNSPNVSDVTSEDYIVNTGLSTADDWEHLLDAHDMLLRAGVDAAKMEGWIQTDPTQSTADEVRLAARAKYASVSSWVEVARPVRDQLREQQRNALVQWLVANSDGIENATDLYDRYLIDVEMSPCTLTSRIKQAIASTQLFIQRCFLGLETYSDTVSGSSGHTTGDTITFTDDDADSWEWRKNYRVWEAARKVFLYPENWLEPELRQQKTELFEELEANLLQGEITEQQVETGFVSYLEGMHRLSNPFIAGIYHERNSETGEDVLHIFGQSRSLPITTWYRRLEDNTRWTPWEETGLDINTPRVAPVVYRGRMMLFWVEINEAVSQDEAGNQIDTLQIRLCWSEKENEQWLPRRQAPITLDTEELGLTSVNQEWVCLRTVENDEGLLEIIIIYRSNSSSSVWTEEAVGAFMLDPCTWDMTGGNGTKKTIQPAPGPVQDEASSYPYYQGYVYKTANFSLSSIDVDSADISLRWSSSVLNEDLEYDPDTMFLSRTFLVGVGGPDDLENRKMVVTVPHQYIRYAGQSPLVLQEGPHSYLVSWVKNTSSGFFDEPSPGKMGFSVAGNNRFDLGSMTFKYSTVFSDGTASASDSPFEERFENYIVDDIGKSRRSRGSSETPVNTSGASADRSGLLSGSDTTIGLQRLHHPYVCDFLQEVRFNGARSLFNPQSSETADLLFQAASDPDYFETVYDRRGSSLLGSMFNTFPANEIDFNINSPQGIYNWELFFHAPLYVASRLRDNAQYDEALKWFHTIFDPRKGDDVWRVRPMREVVDDPITNWEAFTGQDGDSEAATAFEAQIAAWEDSPFDPHVIAELRPIAYQRAVIRGYLDTLIAWGDERFSQDTMETVAEATQLYLYALGVLGPRPVPIDEGVSQAAQSYHELTANGQSLDGFSNALIEIENTLQVEVGKPTGVIGTDLPLNRVEHFCIPRNDAMLAYWDTLDDRLYKIRNCMNIQGVVRSLALFEPPIDPGALVRASAAGADLGTVINPPSTPPLYRFNTVLQAAKALAGSVRGLGSALQSALERRDGEELSLLRSSHEGTLLDMAREVRAIQIKEAQASLEAAQAAKVLAQEREKHYQGLLDVGLIGPEKKEVENLKKSHGWQQAATSSNLIASAVHMGGDFTIKGPPEVGGAYTFGASNIGASFSAAAAVFSAQSARFSYKAAQNARKASRQRRRQDWTFQVEQAQKEQNQHDQTIAAAQKRLDAANQELQNHETQITQRREVYDWMKSKFSNQELYAWMAGQLSSLYSQSYQLALDVARKAEIAYRYELGVSSSNFVRSTHWDSLRKGLLAGEQLQYDLDRMEMSFMDNDIREFELTKHISVSRLDSLALEMLRRKGECWVSIPEELFDLDCPGHYFRRIISIAVTIACVNGAQRQINMELTLQASKTRRSITATDPADDGFSDTPKIVTSAGMEDPGTFSADGGGGRYRPFERRGVISEWKLAFCNPNFPQFDWSTISDVILHFRYTARHGNDSTFTSDVIGGLDEKLRALALGLDSTGANNKISGLVVAVDASRDDPDNLYQSRENGLASLNVKFGSDRLPYFTTVGDVDVKNIYVLATGVTFNDASTTATVVELRDAADQLIESISADGGSTQFANWPVSGLTLWKFAATDADWPEEVVITLNNSDDWSTVQDVLVVLEYHYTDSVS